MADTSDNGNSPVSRKRRAMYVFVLTGALITSAIGFATVFPDKPITEVVVENSYNLLYVVVASYVAASSVDYSFGKFRGRGKRRDEDQDGGNGNDNTVG